MQLEQLVEPKNKDKVWELPLQLNPTNEEPAKRKTQTFS